MTKAQQTLKQAAILIAIYLALYFGIIPLPATIKNEIVPVLPWWGLVTFGSYSLATLGWGVYSFKDKEAEYHTLLKVIIHSTFLFFMFDLDIRINNYFYYRKLTRQRLTCVQRVFQLMNKSLIESF